MKHGVFPESPVLPSGLRVQEYTAFDYITGHAGGKDFRNDSNGLPAIGSRDSLAFARLAACMPAFPCLRLPCLQNHPVLVVQE